MTLQQILRHFKSGKDTLDIAKIYGVTEAEVYNILASRAVRSVAA